MLGGFVVLAVSLLILFAASAQASENAEVLEENAGGIAIYVGGVSADLGAEREVGFAIGLKTPREPLFSSFYWQLGFEYTDKRNTGEFTGYDTSSGDTYFEGRGTVSLKYLQVIASAQFVQQYSSVALAPYIGVEPAILLSQSVSTDQPSGNAFDGFNWYRGFDVLGVIGIEISGERLLFDAQFAWGLLSLKSDEPELDGARWTGTPEFGTSSGKSSSVRLAAGVLF